MPAIVSIVAKVMVLIDEMLQPFVTVAFVAGSGGNTCDLPSMSGGLTMCGQALVDNIAGLIFYGAQLGGYLLPALGVQV